jgi:hypothetical protein
MLKVRNVLAGNEKGCILKGKNNILILQRISIYVIKFEFSERYSKMREILLI